MAEVNTVTESNVIKFEDSEIEQFRKFKDDYTDIIAKFGELEIEIIAVDEARGNLLAMKDELSAKYQQLRADEIKLAEALRTKYGDGEFDITTGIFKPKK